MHLLHQDFPFDAAPAPTIEQLKIVHYSPSLNGRHGASFGLSTPQSHGSGWLRSDLDLQVFAPPHLYDAAWLQLRFLAQGALADGN